MLNIHNSKKHNSHYFLYLLFQTETLRTFSIHVVWGKLELLNSHIQIKDLFLPLRYGGVSSNTWTTDSFFESSPVPVGKWKLSWRLQRLNYKSGPLRTLKRGSAGQLEWEFQVSRQWRRVKWEGTPRDDQHRTSHHSEQQLWNAVCLWELQFQPRSSLTSPSGISNQTSTVRICFL